MDLATQKKDLIKWIHSIEDSDVLKKLESIKSEETFDFDKDWEQVRKTQDLPTRFWSEFEDEMSDKFRKSIGMGYVDVYYKYPDTIK